MRSIVSSNFEVFSRKSLVVTGPKIKIKDQRCISKVSKP